MRPSKRETIDKREHRRETDVVWHKCDCDSQHNTRTFYYSWTLTLHAHISDANGTAVPEHGERMIIDEYETAVIFTGTSGKKDERQNTIIYSN